MKRLLIVWHSRTGGSRQMAATAAESARQEDEVDVRLIEARDAGAEDVLAADGYLFVCPENLASMSGPMKDFFDRTYYAALDQIQGRPYATMICAGSDGEGAARQIARIATGWRLKAIAEPIIVCTHAQTAESIWAAKVIPDEDIERCAERGSAMSAGLALGIY